MSLRSRSDDPRLALHYTYPATKKSSERFVSLKYSTWYLPQQPLSYTPSLLLLHLPLERSKIPLECILHRLHAQVPHILTTRPGLVLDRLLAVVVTDRLLLRFLRPRARLHAQPEIVPVLAARPQLAVPVHVHELPAERLAEEGVVERRAAGHGVRVEGVGGDGVWLRCGLGLGLGLRCGRIGGRGSFGCGWIAAVDVAFETGEKLFEFEVCLFFAG